MILAAVSSCVCGQDISPLRNYHVWLPMTGITAQRMDGARAAGYDTILLKIALPWKPDGKSIDFSATDKLIQSAVTRKFNIIPAILGWRGLGRGQFWDTAADGKKIPDRLDPFWPEAMERLEHYFATIITHYQSCPQVVAFAPTWGIYGEAGFTSWQAGRSCHALACFNQWRQERRLPPLNRLPDRKNGPNTEFNRFIRFRFMYVREKFNGMIKRLKQRAGDIPIGTWQELYAVNGYLWNMVEVPAADFALYESCFPWQSVHHPEKTLAETMGFRYQCNSFTDYCNYYLPLLARKRGEGQRFMGCELTNRYAAENYTDWDLEKARRLQFEQWDDKFAPVLRKLLDYPLEAPRRDVLFVFPEYGAAALSENLCHNVDVLLWDVLLRMYGCQMIRYGLGRLDRQSVESLNRFRLIVVPCAAYLLPETYRKLKQSRAVILFTGCFGQSWDGEYTPFGASRQLDGTTLAYFLRKGGDVKLLQDHPLSNHCRELLIKSAVHLPRDESFCYGELSPETRVLLACAHKPLLSIRAGGHLVFIHGHLLADLCYNPRRIIPRMSGSKDASSNMSDQWGPYDSTLAQNIFGRVLLKNILDYAGVGYRLPAPKPRRSTPFLGDHMEVASISANFLYNNTPTQQKLSVRLPYPPLGYSSRSAPPWYYAEITVPAFSYVALQSATGYFPR